MHDVAYNKGAMMIASQLSLPTIQLYLSDDTRKAVGTMGEIVAARLLERAGYEVSFTHNEKRGDLRAVDPATGVILRIEVKTARRGTDRKWRFLLWKQGHTDYRDANVLILLPILKSGRPVPFIIPVNLLGDRSQIVITSHPEDYAGRWAQYRQKGQLRL